MEAKTALRLKDHPDDVEGIDASLEGSKGQMILTFSQPVESLVLTHDQVAALNQAFGHAAIWLSMHQDDDSLVKIKLN